MTLQQLEVLVAVVRTGSFTKAGQHLALTQSAVSHIISGLESELGFTLLHRNRSGISVTNEGQRIVQHALDILHRAELIKQEAAAIAGVESGVMNLGCFPSLAAKKLPAILLEFQSRYPKIELKLFEGTYHEIENWILDGVIDLGFSAVAPKGLDFIPLWQDELVAAVPEGHPLHARESVSVQEMEAQPFIMPKSGCDTQLKRLFKDHGVSPDIKFEIEDNLTILAMVGRGIGLSVVPSMVIDFAPVQVRPVRLLPGSARTIGILLKSASAASPAAHAFIHMVQNEAGPFG